MSRVKCYVCSHYNLVDGTFCTQCGTAIQPDKEPPSNNDIIPQQPLATNSSNNSISKNSSSTTSNGQQQSSDSPSPSIPPRTTVNISIPMPDKKIKRAFRKTILEPHQQEVVIESAKHADIVLQGMKKYYLEFIKPLEVDYRFDLFHSTPLSPIDFDTPPQVLLLGQYSVGKTSFINYLVEKKVMGSRIGPEPTTDRFCAVMYGKDEKIIPGNAAAVDISLPFRGLDKFGINFLNRFEVSICNSPILENLTFIDTPGVLSGEKQRISREYDFSEVITQFASSASCILILFDASKLDVSDEMKEAIISATKGQEDKVFIVLNKADSLTSQQLIRVYGSLMWSLGRVFSSPEALRVYMGSFWTEELKPTDAHDLLRVEEAELLAALRSLPRNNAIRKVNEMVKRARQVKVHALICNQLLKNFGFFSSKVKTQKKILEDERLQQEFTAVQTEHRVPLGDFPKMSAFKKNMQNLKIYDLPELDHRRIKKIDWVLQQGIPELMKMVAVKQNFETIHRHPTTTTTTTTTTTSSAQTAAAAPHNDDRESGNLPPEYGSNEHFSSLLVDSPTKTESLNPFDDDPDGSKPVQWAIPEDDRGRYTDQFMRLKLIGNQLSGANAKSIMMNSNLSKEYLKTIWSQSDMDNNGYLDCDEFILCMYLIDQTRKTGSVPPITPSIVPPSKRSLIK